MSTAYKIAVGTNMCLNHIIINYRTKGKEKPNTCIKDVKSCLYVNCLKQNDRLALFSC